MLVRYFVPEHGDDPSHPNVFSVPLPPSSAVPLRHIKSHFPLPGDFVFRFKKVYQNRHVWMDVADDDAEVPTFAGEVFAKVQVRVLASAPAPAPAPAGAAAAAAAAKAPDAVKAQPSEKLLSFSDAHAEPAPPGAVDALPFADDLTASVAGPAAAGSGDPLASFLATPSGANGTPSASNNGGGLGGLGDLDFNAFPTPQAQQQPPMRSNVGGMGSGMGAFDGLGTGMNGMGAARPQRRRY